jgi:hypothetical protein
MFHLMVRSWSREVSAFAQPCLRMIATKNLKPPERVVEILVST